jgi:hypothetical protein
LHDHRGVHTIGLHPLRYGYLKDAITIRRGVMTNGGRHGPEVKKKASTKAAKKSAPIPIGKRKLIPAKLAKARSG